MTEMNGTVTGTLLVTPNALMFDPDVVHPLVLENGQDLYIMMARLVYIMHIFTVLFPQLCNSDHINYISIKLIGIKQVSCN